VVFHRQGTRGSVKLNEPVAICFPARRAYLVRKSGPPHDLGLADWEPSREPPMAQPAGIFQWQFQSLPQASTRDHRERKLKTREPLALFNTSTNQYLVYDKTTRLLKWREP
jgi:hypothetical protein